MTTPSYRHLATARRITKRLPGFLQAPIRSMWRWLLRSDFECRAGAVYKLRVAAEKAVYEDQTEVHDLPAIFHYWSNKYLRPKFEEFGFSNPDQFFLKYTSLSLRECSDHPGRILSIGSGNCDTEIRLAKGLVDLGMADFVIDCVDINPAMLDRGRRLAVMDGVTRNLRFVESDFNELQLTQQYDVVIANQSLHHVVALEHLYSEVSKALTRERRFLISDMIGRNGHMRWPEALALVDEIWSKIPESKKYNHQLRRHEHKYENWDCSGTGFEGVRAQDVLPCLRRDFNFELFVGYGNVIDIFIDRGFGPNFDVELAEDRALIDKIHAIDESALLAGYVKPTHAVIVARSKSYAGGRLSWMELSPAKAVRDPSN